MLEIRYQSLTLKYIEIGLLNCSRVYLRVGLLSTLSSRLLNQPVGNPPPKKLFVLRIKLLRVVDPAAVSQLARLLLGMKFSKVCIN